MQNSGPVAVIGAGISGLSCAQTLRLAGVEAHVFESAERLGGRCSTRLWQGHLVDDGIPFFTADGVDFKRELLNCLRQFRPLLAPILGPDGSVLHNENGPRFYVLQGNNYFAHMLAQGLDVRVNAKVERVEFKPKGVIECMGGSYRAIVSSATDAQTSRIFSLNQAAAEPGCCLSVLLEYGEENIGRSQEFFARIMAAQAEPLVASYCENHKSGRVLGNKTVFVLQAGAEFSRAHAERVDTDYLAELARGHEELWEIPSGKLTASFIRRWPIAASARADRQTIDLPPGAFLCGGLPWDAKVEEMWLGGRRAAADVLAYLAG